MNGLAEISSLWMWWNACVKRLRMCPDSVECQYVAAKAQACLVMSQATYWASIRP